MPPTTEQTRAGLDSLTRSELERLNALNAAYRDKFGFPFVYAVRGAAKQEILNALEKRLFQSREAELGEALRAGVSHRSLSSGGFAFLNHFASGTKRHYYGKGDVIAYRLNRDGRTPEGESPVFGANVLMLLYGDAFWKTYTEGDNTGLIATDSMKNFIQRETMNFDGFDLEGYCRFLGDKFLGTYPQVEGLQMSASEIPFSTDRPRRARSCPRGPERAMARIEIDRTGIVEIVSGLTGFKLLRLGGSAFQGFVRDEYTTLPDLKNRPLQMWLDLEWRYTETQRAFTDGRITQQARRDCRRGVRVGRVGEHPAGDLSNGDQTPRRYSSDRGGPPGG